MAAVNNCICSESMWRGNVSQEAIVYAGTVKAIVVSGQRPSIRCASPCALTAAASVSCGCLRQQDWDFDGVKIDSCSEFTNMNKWAELFSASGKDMLLENCHNSDGEPSVPPMGAPAPLIRRGSVLESLFTFPSRARSVPGRQGLPRVGGLPVQPLASWPRYWCVVGQHLQVRWPRIDQRRASAPALSLTNDRRRAVAATCRT